MKTDLEIYNEVEASLPHDAYWKGRCTECGRVRRNCEALRNALHTTRCHKIKPAAAAKFERAS